MTFAEMSKVIERTRYRDWDILLYQVLDAGEEIYLQVSFLDTDLNQQTGRKWRLSTFMTKSEIVQTALKAVLTAEEHEAREHFRYKGEAVFSPHFDVEDLVRLSKEGEPDVRQKVARG